jgi:IclR family acetate operon transcriptional repressor
MPSSSQAHVAQPTLQTVDRALSFLECIANSATPPTIREIAGQLDLNITTCYHLYNTLAARKYVERNPDLTLRIGFQAASLFEGYKRGVSAHQVMRQLVNEISVSTSETAYLSMLVNEAVVLTALSEGPQAIRAGGLYVGLSGLEHVRSSGKAVLAFCSDEARSKILNKALSSTPPAQRAGIREAVMPDLAETRERGWALDEQGYEIGICGIAAPFFSETGDVLGAVGIWAPVARFQENKDSLVSHVLHAAAQATLTLGSAH